MDLKEKFARFTLAKILGTKKTIQALNYYNNGAVALAEVDKQAKFYPKVGSKKIDIPDPTTFLVYGEPAYPKLLSNCNDAPPILFYKGNLACLQDPDKSISIVGSRKYTAYGKRVAASFSEQAVRSGLVTVSGLALGIDAIVHEKTLATYGKTVAVIGTAIDHPYPAQHRYLYDEIIANGGLILSESNQNSAYNKWVFPKRNRIIAGLTPVTLVIEAAEKSGALITADLAIGYDRSVFVVPGNIDSPASAGCFQLLQKKLAEPASSIKDIFPDFFIETGTVADRFTGLALLHNKVIEVIAAGSVVDSEIIVALPDYLPGDIFITIGQLEILGIISKSSNGSYVLA